MKHQIERNLFTKYSKNLVLATTTNKKDLVFALGLITHCASDIVFHPVIHYLSGNYYDKDNKRREKAIYHRY